jgi:hypothetical protein
MGSPETPVSESPSLDIVIQWIPAGLSLQAPITLSPGLYRVRLLNSSSLAPVSDVAWVLLAGRNEYEQKAAAYEEAVTKTRQWSGQVREADVRSYLRAVLESLALL